MSNGYRSIGLAALIAAFFIALFLGAYFGSLYAHGIQHYQSETAYGGKANPSAKTKNGLADITGIDGYTERVIAKPQPSDEEERENRDLAAQENSAVFAYWVFWAVVLQTLLAGGALLALLLDLKQNRKSAEAQLRAYVSLVSGSFDAPISWGEIPSATIYVKNAGATPAYNFRMGGALGVRPMGHQIIVGEPGEHIAGIELGPQCEHMLTVSLDHMVDGVDVKSSVLSTEEYTDIVNGTKAMYFSAKAVYLDAFGKRQTLKVLLRNDGLSNMTIVAEAKQK